MSFSLVGVLLTLLMVSLGQVSGQTLDPHGPPRVDPNPMFLDSFVPATMQIISHVTELMKYEIPATEIPTSTIPPSTSSHRPGIFAPDPILVNRPPSFYYKLGELGNIYKSWATRQNRRKNLEVFGRAHSELYDKVNSINDDVEQTLDDEERLDRFLQDYDDYVPILRRKKPPPPKAYVTLLSLYDSLNREAKKLGLNKYAGYTKNVVQELSEISKGTSAYQMKQVFSKVVERRDVQQDGVLTTLRTLIDDLNDSRSYLNDALRYIPPLGFDSDF